MKNLPLDLRVEIFKYIDDEIVKYWKTIYSKEVLFELNPKDYYTKNVISEIKCYFNFISLRLDLCLCYIPEYNVNNEMCGYCTGINDWNDTLNDNIYDWDF